MSLRLFSKKLVSLVIISVITLSLLPVSTSYAWGPAGHNGTVYSGYLTATERAVIMAASAAADTGTYGPTNSANMSLHGGTTYLPYGSGGNNYVSDIRYLYQAALNVKNGATTVPSTSIYTNVSDNMDDIALYAMGLDLGYGSTASVKAAQILGFAIHLAGDVYAHRTIVPSVSGLNSAYFAASATTICDYQNSYTLLKLQAWRKDAVTSLCHHWNCLNYAISTIKIIETKDITVWQSDSSVNYEDSTSYLSSRYTGAQYTVKYLMGRYSSSLSLTSSLFKPDANGWTFGLQLNGLSEFYSANGWGTISDTYSVSLR